MKKRLREKEIRRSRQNKETEDTLDAELRRNRQRKRKRRLIPLFILLVILLAAFLFLRTARLTDITFTGSDRYSDSVLASMIFPEDKDTLTAWAFYEEHFGEHEDIPFIEKYTVEITGLHSATVTVYEKKIAGCILYMGSYMYFDKDGVVIESSSEKEEEVTLIKGLKFDNIVMYQTLTVADTSVFSEILNITQLIEKEGLEDIEVVFDSSGNVTLKSGSIKGYLGANSRLAEKISEFSDMLPQLEGMAGTVYLDSYDPDNASPHYSFVKDPETDAEDSAAGSDGSGGETEEDSDAEEGGNAEEEDEEEPDAEDETASEEE